MKHCLKIYCYWKEALQRAGEIQKEIDSMLFHLLIPSPNGLCGRSWAPGCQDPGASSWLPTSGTRYWAMCCFPRPKTRNWKGSEVTGTLNRCNWKLSLLWHWGQPFICYWEAGIMISHMRIHCSDGQMLTACQVKAGSQELHPDLPQFGRGRLFPRRKTFRSEVEQLVLEMVPRWNTDVTGVGITAVPQGWSLALSILKQK